MFAIIDRELIRIHISKKRHAVDQYQCEADILLHHSPDENNNNQPEPEHWDNGDPIPESTTLPEKVLKTRSGRAVNRPQRFTYP